MCSQFTILAIPNVSDVTLPNSFKGVNSTDLQEVNSSIKSILAFPVIQERLNAFCDEIDSAEFYESSDKMIRETIQSWREYNPENHTLAENLSYARGIITALKEYIQLDTQLANTELEDEDRRTRKKRVEATVIGVAGVITHFISPQLALPVLVKGEDKLMTMNDDLKAQKKKTPLITKRNNEFIKELDDLLLFF